MREERFVRCGRCGSRLPNIMRDGDVCGCKTFTHPSDAARTENTLRTTPQVGEDWVPVVEMARLSSLVDADGAPVEVTR